MKQIFREEMSISVSSRVWRSKRFLVNTQNLLALFCKSAQKGRRRGWKECKTLNKLLSSVQSVAQSCPTLCDSMNCSTPGLPVHHQPPGFTQTHIHWVSDAIQPSHPLLSPSPPAPNPSQQESFPMSQLFTWGGQRTGVSASASFPPKKSQGWSPSEWTGWISLQTKGLSRVFSNTRVQKHQFFGAQLSSQSNSHIHTWPLEKP